MYGIMADGIIMSRNVHKYFSQELRFLQRRNRVHNEYKYNEMTLHQTAVFF